jgi:hypothetical protein
VTYAVEIPGAKDKSARWQPHVLAITEPYPGQKEWEVEHPACCPSVCDWWPGAAETVEEERRSGRIHFAVERHDCYVAWELSMAGLDSLDLTSSTWPGGFRYAPAEPWRYLKPGRYLIEGWYTPGGWAGSEPVDADGGLTLLGPYVRTPPFRIRSRRVRTT